MFDDLFSEILDGIQFVETVYNPSLQTIDQPKKHPTQRDIELEAIASDERDRVPVKISFNESSFISSLEHRLAGKKHRSNRFKPKNTSSREDSLSSFEGTHKIERDDNLDYSELWINQDLQIRITPNGHKNDAILARLWFRFLPSTEWQSLGVLKVSGSNKKVIYSSTELNFIHPTVRIRILLLLKTQGLIDQDAVKDANCSEKTNAILASRQLQDRLKIRFKSGSNPTMPYTVLEDGRQKKPTLPIEHPQTERRIYPHKTIATVNRLQDEVIKARNEATQANKALQRANRDADRYQDEVERLKADQPKKVIQPVKHGKRYDLSRVM